VTVRVRFVGSGDAFGSGGRFQTCIVVEAPGTRFAIDCGASSLIALAQQGIDPNTLDAVLLSHLHGDHCGGVPFLLMDAMLAARRTRPLTVAGPPGTRARMRAVGDALFPGMHAMRPRFSLEWVELEVGRPNRVLDLTVTAYPARHTAQTNPLALRVDVADRVVSYTGDGEWTADLAEVGRNADLLIAECYFYAKPVPWHLNYPDLARHRADLGAKRVILTHLSREMLARAGEIPEVCAHDGLVIDL
jgi:ribonuclease BN (tRNA processing enzyme)